MTAKWFKDQICEELEGASCYLKDAIDTMKSHPEWSEKFYHMSEAEQHHATELYEMFMDMYTSADPIDQYMKTMRDCIMECFSKSMQKIEDYKTTYGMMAKQEARGKANERSITNSTVG